MNTLISAEGFYMIHFDGRSLDLDFHYSNNANVAYDRLYAVMLKNNIVTPEELSEIKKNAGSVGYEDVTIYIKGRRAFEVAVALDEVLPGSTKSWKEGSGVQHNASVWGPIKNLEDATEDTGEFWDNPAATLMAD